VVELPGARERTAKLTSPVPRSPETARMPTTPVVERMVTGPVFVIVAVPVIRSSPPVRSETCRTDSTERATDALDERPAAEAPAPKHLLGDNAKDKKTAPAEIDTTRDHRARRRCTTRSRLCSDRVAAFGSAPRKIRSYTALRDARRRTLPKPGRRALDEAR
jgi:hypothetical protein